jgi:hypothetical protein
MTGVEEIPIGSRWRYGDIIYDIRARRPIEPGCPVGVIRRRLAAWPTSQPSSRPCGRYG